MNTTEPIRTQKDLSNWYYFKQGFSEDEIQQIFELAGNQEFKKAELETQSDASGQIRKSQIKWLDTDIPGIHWLYEKFAKMCMEANTALWQFELNGMQEQLQFGVYKGDGGHYDWHMDVGPGMAQQRKISIVLQLSEPHAYEGGEFELFVNNEVSKLPKEKGTVILFPSYCMHRVTPVTSGERKSLVLWVSGPAFR